MKTGPLIAIVYSLTLVAIVVGLLLEHLACAQIRRENKALLRSLSEVTGKLAENQRSPDLSASATDTSSKLNPAASPAGAEEDLLRLRGEIAELLQQHQQAELLREDTRQTTAGLEDRRKQDRAARRAANPNPSQLEILKAEYWTDHARMDVTDELQDRIRGDSLKTTAGNHIKGDPEFGQTKHLTIEYRFGGVTRTNEFREGDVIALPAE